VTQRGIWVDAFELAVQDILGTDEEGDVSPDEQILVLERELDRLRRAVFAYVQDVNQCYPTTKAWDSHLVLLEALRREEA